MRFKTTYLWIFHSCQLVTLNNFQNHYQRIIIGTIGVNSENENIIRMYVNSGDVTNVLVVRSGKIQWKQQNFKNTDYMYKRASRICPIAFHSFSDNCPQISHTKNSLEKWASVCCWLRCNKNDKLFVSAGVFILLKRVFKRKTSVWT